MPHKANQTTLRKGDPRASMLAKLGATKRRLNDPDGSAARERARRMNEGRRAKQAARALALLEAKGVTPLSSEDIERLQDQFELERLQRLTLAAAESRRKARVSA